MVFQDILTISQINYISRLQNSPMVRRTVRNFLSACGKDYTNELTRKEASDLISLLLHVKTT